MEQVYSIYDNICTGGRMMADRRAVGRVWWLVAVGAVVVLVLGVWSFLIAEDWGDRFTAGYLIAIAIAAFVTVRRKFVASRSR